MACSNCGSGGTPAGCGSKGNCGTGGCNKMNTYDWITALDIQDPTEFQYAEVSFKKGARKEFFKKRPSSDFHTGDLVVVDADSGSDVGEISLSGELVRLQMKKKKVSPSSIKHEILRVANERDRERLTEARGLEKKTLVKARVIARTLGLDMKIGDIEYQGDKRKATFYYTAEGRVDFRELVRSYAKEFRVKIEMRQIGSRQESGRIGGIGSCGRELCCSTWLSDFQTVTTAAARYQNIAINQTKLSGQCGRLKCCLNYELDAYVDALKAFPKKADKLKSAKGTAALIKTDIFKGIMYYSYIEAKLRGGLMAIGIDRVKEIQEMNKNGEFPEDLIDINSIINEELEKEVEFADVTGVIELPASKRKKRRKSRNSRNKPKGKAPQGKAPQGKAPQGKNAPKSNGNGNSDPTNKGDNKPKGQKPRPKRKPSQKPKGDKPNTNGANQASAAGQTPKEGTPKRRNNRNKNRRNNNRNGKPNKNEGDKP